MRKFISGLAAISVLALPGAALAHSGVAHISGFAQGFFHPFTGLDHLLAMLAIGMLAWRISGQALWRVPLSFVTAMTLGGVMGMSHAPLAAVETAIALSLVALGAAVAFKRHPPLPLTMALAGVFAIFHGHAHGAEVPGAMSGYFYGIGFVTATALLHLAGIALGAFLGRTGAAARRPFLPMAGGLISLAGFALLAGAL